MLVNPNINYFQFQTQIRLLIIMCIWDYHQVNL